MVVLIVEKQRYWLAERREESIELVDSYSACLALKLSLILHAWTPSLNRYLSISKNIDGTPRHQMQMARREPVEVNLGTESPFHPEVFSFYCPGRLPMAC